MRDLRNAVRWDVEARLKRGVACVLAFLRALLGGDRFANLTQALALEIERVHRLQGTRPQVLDYGCGTMAIAAYLRENALVADIRCVDLYPKPAGAAPAQWDRYTQIFPASALPFPDRRFDLAIAVDVLHHAGIGHCGALMAELARCASLVLVKDHFEYGWVSRQLLRLADWYGNWAFGVNVPKRYFTEALWAEMLAAAQLEQITLKKAVRIHSGVFGVIIPPKYHFISLVRSVA